MRPYAVVLALSAASAHAFTNYANDFIDPQIILSKDFSNITVMAQETIVNWADQLAAMGPWSGYCASVFMACRAYARHDRSRPPLTYATVPRRCNEQAIYASVGHQEGLHEFCALVRPPLARLR